MIDKVKILRVERADTYTAGIIYGEGMRPLYTLELPWRDNHAEESCIPAGKYTCALINSPKFEQAWEVVNVPGRSEILFHVGNSTADTKGCILLGVIKIGEFVRESRKAVSLFMVDTMIGGKRSFGIEIIDA